MNLELWTLDFETYYTDKANGGYSLSYMTNEEYIRDPRFEIIGFSLKPAGNGSRWFSGDMAYNQQVLGSLNWPNIVLIGHNMAEFDGLILFEKFGIRPLAYADTLQMARALHNGKESNSLDALCQRYGLRAKGHQVQTYVNKRRADFTPTQLADYGSYCGNSAVDGQGGDVDRTWELYNILAPQLPQNELWTASMVTRTYVQPRIMVDVPLLATLQTDLAARKAGLLDRVADILQVDPNLAKAQRADATQALLRKDAVLASVLKNTYDVPPPMKYSKKRKNPDGSPLLTYAFAKTDEGMEELLNYEDDSDPAGAEDIQALAAARLGVKSTLAESRVARFLGIGQRGMLPVPLAYGKTHTHRLAGSQKLNMQNLSGTKGINEKTPPGTLIRTPRGIERLYMYNKSTNQIMLHDGVIIDVLDAAKERQCWVVGLRDCIIAPPGKRLVVVDSAQIELRVCHALAGQMDTVDELRRGVDVYSSFASSIYNRPISKKDHKERQHGKVGMLQLQYQSGWKAFKNSARVMGGVRLTEDQAASTVDIYRNRFTEVRKFWRTCQQAIDGMAKGGGRYIDEWGLCRTEQNRIVMPGRMPLVYHNLRQELLSFDGQDPELHWVYDDKEKRHMKKIYGGSVTENLCQWIAGSIVKDQTLECERRWGNYHQTGNGVVLMVHDEAVLCVDEDDAEECLKFCTGVFQQAPSWWPILPVDGEGGIGIRYSEAK